MEIGDKVVRKSYGRDITFKIVNIVVTGSDKLYILKGISLRIEADAPEDDLEIINDGNAEEKEVVFNRKVNSSIKNILINRMGIKNAFRSSRTNNKTNDDMTFGRPGKVLHIDGDGDYLEVCLKVYKQLKLDAVGKMIKENEQPNSVLELVKQYKPDIVVITGHDAITKGTVDYMDVANYRNSKYFVETVTQLRNFEHDYDELVIIAGACQSCYEAILDAGANFASSPNRVVIHCLDPVFVCEKIAYSNIDKILSIQEALENTITGSKGLGGLQTRGKYREGFPKSPYI